MWRWPTPGAAQPDAASPTPGTLRMPPDATSHPDPEPGQPSFTIFQMTQPGGQRCDLDRQIRPGRAAMAPH